MTSCSSTLAVFPVRIAVFHCVGGPPSESCRLVFYESHNHAVEVEEEHDQVEAELDERFLLVYIQFPEDLRGVQEMLVVEDLLCVECQQRQIQEQGDPVSIDQEQKGQEGVYGGFGDDVGIQTITQINWVDIVAFQIAVHDSEENL